MYIYIHIISNSNKISDLNKSSNLLLFHMVFNSLFSKRGYEYWKDENLYFGY